MKLRTLWPWIILSLAFCFGAWLAGCSGQSSRPSIMDQNVESQILHLEEQRRDALLKLCEDNFDLACMRVQDQSIAAYLINQ